MDRRGAESLAEVREKAPLLAYGGFVLLVLGSLLAGIAWAGASAMGNDAAAETISSTYSLVAFPLTGLVLLSAYVLHLPDVYRRGKRLLSAVVGTGTYEGRRRVVVFDLLGTVLTAVGVGTFAVAYGVLNCSTMWSATADCRPYEVRNESMPFVTGETAVVLGVSLVVVSGVFYAMAYLFRDSGGESGDADQHVTDRF